MEPTGTGQSTSTLDELLSSYFELCNRRDVLEERLQRAQTAKESVSPRIFEKVRAEYENELESVHGRLRPLKEELESHRRDVEAEMEDAESKMRNVEDELAEARFRFEVGEFDENKFRDAEKAIEPRLDKLRFQRDGLHDRLEAFDRRREEKESPSSHSDDDGETNSADWINPRDWAADGSASDDSGFDGSEPDPAETSTTCAPETSGAPDPTMPAISGTSVDESAPHVDDHAVTGKSGNADPLVALADPKVESIPDSGPGMPTLPTLSVRTGPHAGRTIPLLPMTMSIGRESDNNIELKDPDVARYHARIVYERGRFSLENLDGSNGTYINGESVSRADLNDGDRIVIGSTELVFELS